MKFFIKVVLLIWVSYVSGQSVEVLYQQKVKLNTSWNLNDALDCGTGKGQIIIRSDSILLQAETCQHLLNRKIPISSVTQVKRAWWMIAPHTTIIYTAEGKYSFITYRRRKIIQTIRNLLRK